MDKAIQTEYPTQDQCAQAGDGYISKDENEFASSSENLNSDREEDSIYMPSVDSEQETDDEFSFVPEDTTSQKDVLNEPKFTVFSSTLMMLLNWVHCPSCGSHDTVSGRSSREPRQGTLLTVKIFCESCKLTTNWLRQPYVKGHPAGNILLTTAIMCSGSPISKVLRLLKFMRVWGIQKSTFFRHQREIFQPAITRLWERQQENLIGLLRARGDGIVVGGDGRCDSVGHCAKYGIYTCIELVWNCIIDIRIVTSTEVGGSYHMELEGLKLSLNYLMDWLDITKLVTDRHMQVSKWVRENFKNILHLYDLWHVAKGLGKKLEALAKNKGCEEIRPWIQSIVNHMYWSAVSTEEGNGAMIVSKWISVINHITNRQTHGDHLFPKCIHGPLDDTEWKTKWIQPGSKAAVLLEELCLNKRLLSDVSKLSGDEQTWNLEAFHSLLNQFAPKMFYFTPFGMDCRTKVAVLHYNEMLPEARCTLNLDLQCTKSTSPNIKRVGMLLRRCSKIRPLIM